MHLTYHHTRYTCYLGYITQAIVNNLSPLFFLIFQQEFQVTLTQISLIITPNFAIQMAVDLITAKYVDRIGYRISIASAQIFLSVWKGKLAFPVCFLGNITLCECFPVSESAHLHLGRAW